MNRLRSWAAAVMALGGGLALGQPATQPGGGGEDGVRDGKKRAIVENAAGWTDSARVKFGNDADYVVRPNLLVDRKGRIVTIRGYATGIGRGEPVEFFLIGPGSGKGYESLAVSLALPSDIEAGLEAIGLKPGRPVDYAHMRFWPKGERVKVTYRWGEKQPDGNVSDRKCRAEELVMGRESHQPMAATGLVFVGGLWVDGGAGDGGGTSRPARRFYADLGDPGSIASNYNEATTVLDVPAQARQSAVYQSWVVNPAYALPALQPLEITFEPEHPTGSRVVDVTVRVSGEGDLAGLQYQVGDGAAASGDALLASLQRRVADGEEPFVTVIPGAEVPLKAVKALYALLESLEGEKGVRLEPPAAGHLFHEAFSPEEAYRDYKKRTWQPVEVHLDAGGKATLRDIEDADGDPTKLNVKETAVDSPAALAGLLKARADQRRPWAVYAPAGMAYGKLVAWLGPALTDDAVVWVYLE